MTPSIVPPAAIGRAATPVELIDDAAEMLTRFCDQWQGDDARFRHDLARMCCRLVSAQPNVPGLLNLCNEVLFAAERDGVAYVRGQPVRATAAQAASNAALKFSAFLGHHARRIANELLPYVHSGSLLLTHSYSETVLAALLQAHDAGKRFGVVCTESRPRREGVRMARDLARAGIETEVIVDSAAAVFIHGFYTLLIGAEAIGADGVANAVGTFGMALTAHSLGVPVYCLAGSEKFLPSGAQFTIAERERGELIEPEKNLHDFNLHSDLTPLGLITRYFVEDGTYVAANMHSRLSQRELHPALAASA